MTPLSITAIENLLNYACTHFEIHQTRNTKTCCLAVPLLPCRDQPDDFVNMLKRVASKTSLSLEHFEFYIDDDLLDDRHMRNILQAIASLPVNLSIRNFSFSLNSLAFLNQINCQSIRINMEALHKAEVTADPEWLQHLLAPCRKKNLLLFAEHIASDNDLLLAKQIGCSEASGHHINHLYQLNQ